MTAAKVRTAGVVRGDDMHDTPEELDALHSSPALQRALQILSSELTPVFDEADRKALQHQRSYQRITWWATTFGTISILFSIGALVAEVLDATEYAQPILIAQSVTLTITAIAVLRGLFAYRHENWLLERCRAEQLRAYKFKHLLDPALWSEDEHERSAWGERVRTDVERARALRYQDIAAIAGQEDVPSLRTPRIAESAAVDVLAGYYDRKRLTPQREYFLQASRDPHHFGARALPLFFFGAVFLEVLQAALTFSARSSSSVSLTVAATWLAASALALPAIWAGIRTQHGARESSRNATRSKARHGALTQLSERMLAARGHPIEILWTMRLTEFVLQIDQREWLRLLREAEWYG